MCGLSLEGDGVFVESWHCLRRQRDALEKRVRELEANQCEKEPVAHITGSRLLRLFWTIDSNDIDTPSTERRSDEHQTKR